MRTPLLFAALALLAGCKTITVEERHVIRPDALSGKAPTRHLALPHVEALELARPDGAVLKNSLCFTSAATCSTSMTAATMWPPHLRRAM
jgi:uncharacterized protein